VVLEHVTLTMVAISTSVSEHITARTVNN